MNQEELTLFRDMARRAFENNADLLFGMMLLAGLATDRLDQLLRCISHDETPLYIVINVSEVSLRIEPSDVPHALTGYTAFLCFNR